MSNISAYLSKILKTDFGYILKNISFLSISQIITSIFIFVSAIAFANLLDKRVYGSYQYILTLIEFIFLFSLTGISRSIIRSVARGYDGSLHQAFLLNLKWSIPAIGIGYMVAGYYLFQGNLEIAGCIFIAVSLQPLLQGARMYSPFLSGKKKFLTQSITNIIAIAIPLAIIVGVLLYTQNLFILIAIYFFAHTFTNLAIYLYCIRLVENSKKNNEMFSLGKHLSFLSTFATGVGQIDKILLFHFIGPAALAEFIFASSLPRQLQHANKSLRAIALPKISQRDFAVLRYSLPKKIAWIYAIIIPLILTYIAIAPHIFEIVFPQYVNVVYISQFFSLILLFSPLSFIEDVFISQNIHKPLYTTNISSTFVHVFSSIILIPLFGINGILGARLLTSALRSTLLLFLFYSYKHDKTIKNQ